MKTIFSLIVLLGFALNVFATNGLTFHNTRIHFGKYNGDVTLLDLALSDSRSLMATVALMEILKMLTIGIFLLSL